MTNKIEPIDVIEPYRGRLITITQTSGGNTSITTACIDTNKQFEVRNKEPDVANIRCILRHIIDQQEKNNG